MNKTALFITAAAIAAAIFAGVAAHDISQIPDYAEPVAKVESVYPASHPQTLLLNDLSRLETAVDGANDFMVDAIKAKRRGADYSVHLRWTVESLNRADRIADAIKEYVVVWADQIDSSAVEAQHQRIHAKLAKINDMRERF